jgi:hypothetical protein
MCRGWQAAGDGDVMVEGLHPCGNFYVSQPLISFYGGVSEIVYLWWRKITIRIVKELSVRASLHQHPKWTPCHCSSGRHVSVGRFSTSLVFLALSVDRSCSASQCHGRLFSIEITKY